MVVWFSEKNTKKQQMVMICTALVSLAKHNWNRNKLSFKGKGYLILSMQMVQKESFQV